MRRERNHSSIAKASEHEAVNAYLVSRFQCPPSRAATRDEHVLMQASEWPATRDQPSWMTVIFSPSVTARRFPGSSTATLAGPENGLPQTIELSACPVSRPGHSACSSPVGPTAGSS